MIIHNYVTDVFYCLLFSTIIILVSGLNSIRLWQVHTSTLVERVQFRFIIEGEICLLYLGQIFQIWVIDIHVCCGSVLQYNNQYLFNYYIFLYLTSFTKSRMYWFSSGRFFCSPKSYKISYIQSIIISLLEKKKSSCNVWSAYQLRTTSTMISTCTFWVSIFFFKWLMVNP